MINHYSSATAMLQALRERTVSAAELLDLHIKRIEAIDGTINAVVIRDFERARSQAAAIDSRPADTGQSPGALSGLPMTIKESINVAGWKTCCGVEAASKFVSAHDAPATTRLQRAGAVLMGKTNIPVELADWQSDNPVYGRTNNPYNLSRSPGGSSGGSAAALASGMTPLEVGSDIGGSIRVPAAFCGVFGHRPSETALAKSGQFPIQPTPIPAALLGVQGPMARTADDVALGLSVLAGADIGEDKAWQLHMPAARHNTLKDFRVAVMAVPDWIALDPAIRSAQDSLVDALRARGVNVSVQSPEAIGNWQDYYNLYLRILGAMIGARAPDDIRAQRIEKMREAENPESADMITGMNASVANLFAWLGQREHYRRAWQQFFESFDVFIAPACMRPAYPHLPLEGAPFVSSWHLPISVDNRSVPYSSQVFYPGICTLPGLPSTAVPVGRDSAGLPIGLQVLGPYLEDYTPLRFASLLEKAGLAGFSPPTDFA